MLATILRWRELEYERDWYVLEQADATCIDPANDQEVKGWHPLVFVSSTDGGLNWQIEVWAKAPSPEKYTSLTTAKDEAILRACRVNGITHYKLVRILPEIEFRHQHLFGKLKPLMDWSSPVVVLDPKTEE